MQEFNRYDNLNYLLRRNDEFLAVDGRPETDLPQAKEKDQQILAVLEKYSVPYTVISPWETDKVLLDLKIKGNPAMGQGPRALSYIEPQTKVIRAMG